MNKNKVIHLCELCLERRETQEGVEGRGGVVRQVGIKAMVEAQFIKGQDIITDRNACSTGGHRNAFSSA